MSFNVDEIGLSKKQKERFVFLMGPRYDPLTGKCRLIIKQFKEFHFNKNRGLEILQETLLEALRAPQD